MFEFIGSPVPVRQDLKIAYGEIWAHFAGPGPTLTGSQRVSLAAFVRAARSGDTPAWPDLSASVLNLAALLFTDPGRVDRSTVRTAADDAGDPMTVEVISIVSMLAAVDGGHRGLAAALEPLPEPREGAPTTVITEGLKQRRTYIPMPAGAIPLALNLLPEVGKVFQDSFGPQYMTESEMGFNEFGRTPGLNRAQIEVVSSRTSLHNKCFYWTLSHVRMLSSSAIAYDYDLDIAAIRDPSISSGIPGGTELLHFVDALIVRGTDALAPAQAAIIDRLGPESLVDAAAVFGNFEMMNRVAEGSGISIPPQAIERMKDTIDELGMISLLKS